MLFEANELLQRGTSHNVYKPPEHAQSELDKERKKQHQFLEKGHAPQEAILK